MPKPVEDGRGHVVRCLRVLRWTENPLSVHLAMDDMVREGILAPAISLSQRMLLSEVVRLALEKERQAA